MIRIIDRAEIFRVFDGMGNVFVADGKYALPCKQWIQDFAHKWRKIANTKTWADKYDCDDFAMAFKLAVQEAHWQSDQTTNDGLAVGIVHYHSDRGGGHAINWAVTEDGLIYIEPQTGEIICLSEQELRSRFFVYA